MVKKSMGKTSTGLEITQYTLNNGKGLEVDINDFGATLVNCRFAGKDGVVRDLFLGYDNAADFEKCDSYLGAIIARNGNRIAGAKITLDGVEYQLEANDLGVNNLHAAGDCPHTRVWSVEECDDTHIKLSIVLADMENGFPGNFNLSVTYTLTDDNGLELHYEGTTDKTTIANCTNHVYINLNGHETGSVEGQYMQLNCSKYTPVIDSHAIPTGEEAPVAGTPMDFTKETMIGERIDSDFDQLQYVIGYDHNYCVDGYDGKTMNKCATAYAKESGIQMDVYTDCVGVQFYTANHISSIPGKGGVTYGKRHGFCLETQYYPNSANDTRFVQPILKVGEKYDTKTKYVFSVK